MARSWKAALAGLLLGAALGSLTTYLLLGPRRPAGRLADAGAEPSTQPTEADGLQAFRAVLAAAGIEADVVLVLDVGDASSVDGGRAWR